MSNAQLGRLSSPSHDFSESAIARARAATHTQGLYVSRVLVVGGIGGDLRTFVRHAGTANRLGCQGLLVVGSFGFQSQLLQGDAYLDQAEKYAQRFGLLVVWTPGEDDNAELLSRIPADADGLITLRSRIRCAPDRSSWLWGSTAFATINDTTVPAQVGGDDALAKADVLVVHGALLGQDAVVSPKLRIAVYGTPAHRLVSGAAPRTGRTVEWTEQTVLDLASFSFCSSKQPPAGIAGRRGDDFDEGLGYLRLYTAEFKDSFVPRSYVAEDGFRLGRWTALIRSDYEAGRLDAKKIKALQTVAFWQWDPFEPAAVTAPVPAPTTSRPVETTLVPVSSLPQPTELAAGAPAAAERLPSRLTKPLPFEEWLGQLEKYVAEHGHARPPKNYIDSDGYKLGRWVFRLRNDDRRSRLTPEEVAAVSALPGWSWERKKKAADEDEPLTTAPAAASVAPAPGGPVPGAASWLNALGGPVGTRYL